MMSARQFRQQRQQSWSRFSTLVNRVDSRGWRKLKPQETSEYSRLFREICHDLSVARSREFGTTTTTYLNDLVARGHNCFYKSRTGRLADFIQFLAVGFPRVFRKNIGYFLAASALFFLPLVISWYVIQNDPSLAPRVLPSQTLDGMEAMYDSDEGLGFGSERALMGGFYVRNNVGIALQCFAHGILVGLGTIYVLLTNGIQLGAISGYLIAKGHSQLFLGFVVSHGSFELTAIAVSGGAGLMLAHAIIHPGQRTRLESLRVQGLEAVQIAAGAGAMLMVAAMIEAFWSPAPVPEAVKYSGAGLLWLLVILYLTLGGRGGGSG